MYGYLYIRVLYPYRGMVGQAGEWREESGWREGGGRGEEMGGVRGGYAKECGECESRGEEAEG